MPRHLQDLGARNPRGGDRRDMRELKQEMKPSIAGFDLIFGRLTGLEDAFCLGSVKDFEEIIVT